MATDGDDVTQRRSTSKNSRRVLWLDQDEKTFYHFGELLLAEPHFTSIGSSHDKSQLLRVAVTRLDHSIRLAVLDSSTRLKLVRAIILGVNYDGLVATVDP